MNKKLHRLVITAMFAAIICVATMVIRIPSPMGGYINLGDCFILVGAWILGPVYGFAAGSVGSAMADLISGYAVYAPATLIIKGFMATAAALITKNLLTARYEHKTLGYTTGAIAAELIMILGYAVYDCFLYGTGFIAAVTGVGNIVQGFFGAAAGIALFRALSSAGLTSKLEAYASRSITHK